MIDTAAVNLSVKTALEEFDYHSTRGYDEESSFIPSADAISVAREALREATGFDPAKIQEYLDQFPEVGASFPRRATIVEAIEHALEQKLLLPLLEDIGSAVERHWPTSFRNARNAVDRALAFANSTLEGQSSRFSNTRLKISDSKSLVGSVNLTTHEVSETKWMLAERKDALEPGLRFDGHLDVLIKISIRLSTVVNWNSNRMLLDDKFAQDTLDDRF